MINSKIYITLLIFVKEGNENDFNTYEENVLPLLEKYNGKLEYRYLFQKSVSRVVVIGGVLQHNEILNARLP